MRSQRSLEEAAIDDAAESLAHVLHATYRALRKKGFTADQAFELTKSTLMARDNANPGD